jgi:DNA uptake protein ComE-like DNA-binding protein
MKLTKLKNLLVFNTREKNGIMVLLFFVLIVGSVNALLPFVVPKHPLKVETFVIDGEQEREREQERELERDLETRNQKPETRNQKQNENEPYRTWEQGNYVKKAVFTGVIELNTADTVSLRQLKGVGAYFARKIIEYRNKLGGYISVDQVAEIYNFPPELFASIKPQLSANIALIKRLRINFVNDSTLDAHPYISGKEARILTSYRTKHGPFGSCTDFQKVIAISSPTIERLCPYLTFE